jgi:hypothetical protein
MHAAVLSSKHMYQTCNKERRSNDNCDLIFLLQITVVEEDDVQLFAPPPTARQTLAGGHPSSSAGAATATAAAAAMAEQAQSTTWLDKLPARFGFLGRAQLARRRSSRAGAASGAGDVTMTWASFDDSSTAGQTAPLLQFDMQVRIM